MEKTIHIDVETEITKIMDELSVPANIKGYSYLRSAIMMTVNEPEMIYNGTGKLYTALAEQ